MSETAEETKTENNETAVIHIRFKAGKKTSVLEMNDIDAEVGSWVVAESDIGLGLATVVKPKEIILKTREPLKKVLRAATEKDFKDDEKNRAFEDEAKLFCSGKAKERSLEMKVVTTESTLDRKKLIFYFTADNRVDFRELVRDLASKFKTRIEMRQIGVRDEVKLLGGIGVCGGETCCSRFLTHFAPISIKMAKKQDLSINQGKLSGICGRLMCCLNYEMDAGGKKKCRAAARQEKKGSGNGRAAPVTPPQKVAPDAPVKEVPAGNADTKPEASAVVPSGEKKGRGRQGRRRKKPSDDQKKQGNPSNKRRGFWKKKKPQQETGNKESADKKAGTEKKEDGSK